jgi:hypothetical protein
VRPGDRPAGLDRVAGRLPRAPPRGAGRLRAGAGDAPRFGALPGRGQDRSPRQFRARRHARTHARRLHSLEASDETLDRLRLPGGYDDDLAHGVNRTANRLRDMLLAVSPALERVLGPRLDHPAARALLARYHTPTALRAAGPRRLTPLAKRHAPSLGRPARRRGPGCARRPDRHRPRRGDSRPGHPRARRRVRPTSPATLRRRS